MFEVLEKRCVIDHGYVYRMGIVDKARNCDMLGAQTTAHFESSFQQQDF